LLHHSKGHAVVASLWDDVVTSANIPAGRSIPMNVQYFSSGQWAGPAVCRGGEQMSDDPRFGTHPLCSPASLWFTALDIASTFKPQDCDDGWFSKIFDRIGCCFTIMCCPRPTNRLTGWISIRRSALVGRRHPQARMFDDCSSMVALMAVVFIPLRTKPVLPYRISSNIQYKPFNLLYLVLLIHWRCSTVTRRGTSSFPHRAVQPSC
jgi:hypothetical protein